MRADETSAGAVVDVQRRSPSDAARGRTRRCDEASVMAALSTGGERAASGSPLPNEAAERTCNTRPHCNKLCCFSLMKSKAIIVFSK